MMDKPVIQQIPPTEWPTCPDCGHPISGHASWCSSPFRGYTMFRDEAARLRRLAALDERGKMDSPITLLSGDSSFEVAGSGRGAGGKLGGDEERLRTPAMLNKDEDG